MTLMTLMTLITLVTLLTREGRGGAGRGGAGRLVGVCSQACACLQRLKWASAASRSSHFGAEDWISYRAVPPACLRAGKFKDAGMKLFKLLKLLFVCLFV